MSFQPFVSRWYFAIPSTIAAESCGAYSFAVTVWWTKPACTTPYARRGSRRHGGGAPGVARDDRGRAPGLARRRPARRGRAAPSGPWRAGAATPGRRRGARAATRAAPARDGAGTRPTPPVQIGSEACSPVPVSGAWSPCAASGIHGLQSPPRARTRTSTRPEPADADQVEPRARGARGSCARRRSRRGVTVRPKPRGSRPAARAERATREAARAAIRGRLRRPGRGRAGG